MKIEGQLEKEDHVKAYRLNRWMISWDLGILYFSVLMIVRMVAEAWIRKSHGRESDGDLAIYGSLALVGLALYYLADRLWIPRKLREQADSDAPKEIEINTDGITTGTPDGKESVSWLRLHKYRVGKDMTLLYRYGGESLIFPDRWFTPLEKVEFEKYLRKEIGEPAR